MTTEGIYLARVQENQARRHSLAVKLERLAGAATQTAQELRDGTNLNLDHSTRLQARVTAVWEAMALERATRP